MRWPAKQACLHCKDCLLDKTAGLCPIRLCPKGLVNGPCGGAKKQRCETDTLATCVWSAIFQRVPMEDYFSATRQQLWKDFSRPVNTIRGETVSALR